MKVEKAERPSVKDSLMLENARIHHAPMLSQTWTILSDQYKIDGLYPKPYSPFLNPIELFEIEYLGDFEEMKSRVTKEFHCEKLSHHSLQEKGFRLRNP